MSITLNPPPMEIPSEFQSSAGVSKFFDTLLRTIYQIWKETYNLRYSETVTTTDATVTAAQRVNVDTDKSIYIDAKVVARRTGGSAGTEGDSAWYFVQAGFKNISDTVTLVGSVVQDGGEDQAGWDAGFAISGTQAVLVVTGAANNDITWETELSYREVGV